MMPDNEASSLYPAMSNDNLKNHGLQIFIAAFLALAQYRLILLVFGNDYGRLIAATQGIVDGYPHWVIYQSRILGPYFIKLIAQLTGHFAIAYLLFVWITFFITGYWVLRLMARLVEKTFAWTVFFVFQTVIAALISNTWFYPWDGIGLIIYTVFIYFALNHKSYLWLVALFSVALFNRESAFYIAFYMIISPIVNVFLNSKATPRTDWSMILSGLLCAAIGFSVISALRRVLLIKEIGPELWGLPDFADKQAHIQITENIQFIQDAIHLNNASADLFVPAMFLFILILLINLAVRYPQRWLALCITHLVLLVSLLVFAVLRETRIFFEFVPFIAIGSTWILYNPSDPDQFSAKSA